MRGCARLALCAASALLGCNGQGGTNATSSASATTTASASATPKKSKLTGFVASIDGQELILESAVAFSRGGSALHLTISTHPLACDKMGGAGFRLERGEFLVDFTVAPVVGTDGESKWMVTGSRLGDVSRQGALGDVEVARFNPHKTVEVSFDKLKLAFPPKSLTLDGKLLAEGCRVIPVTDRAQVRPQKDLTVELDGKKRTMNGASLSEGKRGKTLRLTSEPHACGKGTVGSDVGIDIVLADDGASSSTILVNGFSVPRPLRSQPTDAPVSVQIEPPAGTESAVTLAGTTTLAGHNLRLDGIARVEICR